MIAAIRTAAALLAGLAALLSAPPADATPFPAGPSRHTAEIGGKAMTVFVYRPTCADPSLLVIFHGVNRNPHHQRDDAAPLADKLCLIVLAPLFDKATYPSWRYQRGGIVRNDKVRPAQDWTGTLALELVAWARKEEGRELPYSLFGHSAGAQFLGRVAAYTPTQARRIIIGDPSSYVLPSPGIPAPYGFGKLYPPDTVDAELKRYLSLPIAIVLGQDDRGSKNLGVTPGAVAQGANRYDRGRNAFKAAQDEAQRLGIPLKWQLVELPGVRHNAGKVLASDRVRDILAPAAR